MEQTNQYVKQFPELFKGKTIIYVHGFGSSGQSGTVTRLRTVLPNTTVIQRPLTTCWLNRWLPPPPVRPGMKLPPRLRTKEPCQLMTA